MTVHVIQFYEGFHNFYFHFLALCGKIYVYIFDWGSKMIQETLTRFSNKYGSDGELVLAGGGNTSAKDGGILFVKGSGVPLAAIDADGFVKMDRVKLAHIMEKDYPKDDKEREAAALDDLMAARLPSERLKRPSVETLLHNLFPQRYVLHLHPALVNGLTCSANGEEEAQRLFGGGVLWIRPCKPGYVLSKICRDRMDEYKRKTGSDAAVMLLQNHGIFIAGGSEGELDDRLSNVIGKIQSRLTETPDFSPFTAENNLTKRFRERIDALYGKGFFTLFEGSRQAADFAKSVCDAAPLLKPFTPDHIVYCGAHPVFTRSPEALDADFLSCKSARGYAPKIIIAEGLGFFAVSESKKNSETALLMFKDAMKIAVYSKSFGGPLHMQDDLTDFIINWEAESYRSGQNN